MNKNIGDFLQESRKNIGITQKELADQIGISDKTISKWENGNSVPDASMLLPLCNALGITVNELLSCEKISPENYSAKAEENMLELIKENTRTKKGNIIAKIIGVLVICFGLFLIVISNAGSSFMLMLINYIDMASFVIDVVLVAGAILVSGAKTKESILDLLSRILIPLGLMIFIVTEFIMLYFYEKSNTSLAINTAVAAIPLLYMLIVKIIVELILSKKQR